MSSTAETKAQRVHDDAEQFDQFPPRLWGLDPLYWTHVKLFISHIHKLPSYSDPDLEGAAFRLYSHPIAKAEIVGFVVGLKIFADRIAYTVDDGTATITCVCWVDARATGGLGGVSSTESRDAENDDARVALRRGDLVRILGKIAVYGKRRELRVETFSLESDPNAEVLHWLEVMELHKVYAKLSTVQLETRPQAARQSVDVLSEACLQHLLQLQKDGSASSAPSVSFRGLVQHAQLRELAVNLVSDVSGRRKSVPLVRQRKPLGAGAVEAKAAAPAAAVVDDATGKRATALLESALAGLVRSGAVHVVNALSLSPSWPPSTSSGPLPSAPPDAVFEAISVERHLVPVASALLQSKLVSTVASSSASASGGSGSGGVGSAGTVLLAGAGVTAAHVRSAVHARYPLVPPARVQAALDWLQERAMIVQLSGAQRSYQWIDSPSPTAAHAAASRAGAGMGGVGAAVGAGSGLAKGHAKS